jgi:hypothetical protein
MKQTEAEKMAEQALNSLDGIQPAPVNGFLYTRIHNRMDALRQTGPGRLQFQYRLSVFVLMLCIVINLFAWMALYPGQSNTQAQQNDLNGFAQEYGLAPVSLNY